MASLTSLLELHVATAALPTFFCHNERATPAGRAQILIKENGQAGLKVRWAGPGWAAYHWVAQAYIIVI